MRATAAIVILIAVARVSCAPLDVRFERQELPGVGVKMELQTRRLVKGHRLIGPALTGSKALKQLKSSLVDGEEEDEINGELADGEGEKEATGEATSNHSKRSLTKRVNETVVAVAKDVFIAFLSGIIFTSVLALITAGTGGNPFSRTWNPPTVNFATPDNSTTSIVMPKSPFSAVADEGKNSPNSQDSVEKPMVSKASTGSSEPAVAAAT